MLYALLVCICLMSRQSISNLLRADFISFVGSSCSPDKTNLAVFSATISCVKKGMDLDLRHSIVVLKLALFEITIFVPMDIYLMR